MRTRFAWLVAAAGLLALLATPAGSGAPDRLAAAGSDVPVWGFVLVGLVLVVGAVLVVLGLLRRRRAGAGAEAPQRSADD